MNTSRIITRVLIGIIIVLVLLFLIQAIHISAGSGSTPSTPGYYYHSNNSSQPNDEPPAEHPISPPVTDP
jgi:hypothetical protein